MGRHYLKDFHRKSIEASQNVLQHMWKHPYSLQQMREDAGKKTVRQRRSRNEYIKKQREKEFGLINYTNVGCELLSITGITIFEYNQQR